MRELFRLTGVLVVICCGASFALALVHEYTREPIAYQQRMKTIRAVNAVFPQHEDAAGLEIVAVPLCEDGDGQGPCRRLYRIKHNDRVLGTAFQMTAKGYGGPIRLMLGVVDGDRVSGVHVISHSETPGLGANITRDAFCRQYTGLDLAGGLQLRSDGGEIDQVSGATISSAAVTGAVREGLRFFVTNKKRISAAKKES